METDIATAVLALIADSASRLTSESVTRILAGQAGFSRRQVRAAIRSLVEAGELSYSYELGCSFLERSFNRPLKASTRIVLAPPDQCFQPSGSEVLVRLSPGAAFGDGRHPTTRLALEAIEAAIGNRPEFLTNRKTRILDIGTGSGVLVIAAVLMGLKSGTGIDIDPCSIAEAKKNVVLNTLGRRIDINDLPLETQTGRFSMITANLRYPTLSRISTDVAKRIERRGAFIMSGIKPGELDQLIKSYTGLGFEFDGKWREKGWAAMLMWKRSDRKGP